MGTPYCRKVHVPIVICVYLLLSLSSSAQQFLNGSFEINTVGDCGNNLPNLTFTESVAYAAAFGRKNEVDVLSEVCGYGKAQDGDYFVAIYNNSSTDVIGLELSEPLNAGESYTLMFYDKAGNEFGRDGTLEIGIADAPLAFGETIAYVDSIAGDWQLRQLQFTAPISGKYIAIRLERTSDSWVFLDNFKLACPTSIDLGNDTTLCKVENLELGLLNTFETYRWSDNSTNPTLTINAPGTYWVEVSKDDCTLRDTIVIAEIVNNCECNIYAPNAFSPNADGYNDEFLVQTPCVFVEYHLAIFNRWGQLLFESKDPLEGWNGETQSTKSDTGVYLFRLTYQFDYQSSTQTLGGDITLIR